LSWHLSKVAQLFFFFFAWANLVISTSTYTAWWTFSRFWLVHLVKGWPQRSWSSPDIFPLLKWLNH
jgi:hypothetical protein